MHLELFKVTSTPKKGTLAKTRKSLGKFENREDLDAELNKQKAKKAPFLVVENHDDKEALAHVLERKNYRIRPVEYAEPKTKPVKKD